MVPNEEVVRNSEIAVAGVLTFNTGRGKVAMTLIALGAMLECHVWMPCNVVVIISSSSSSGTFSFTFITRHHHEYIFLRLDCISITYMFDDALSKIFALLFLDGVLLRGDLQHSKLDVFDC